MNKYVLTLMLTLFAILTAGPRPVEAQYWSYDYYAGGYGGYYDSYDYSFATPYSPGYYYPTFTTYYSSPTYYYGNSGYDYSGSYYSGSYYSGSYDTGYNGNYGYNGYGGGGYDYNHYGSYGSYTGNGYSYSPTPMIDDNGGNNHHNRDDNWNWEQGSEGTNPDNWRDRDERGGRDGRR
jgi:hypothetical protein